MPEQVGAWRPVINNPKHRKVYMLLHADYGFFKLTNLSPPDFHEVGPLLPFNLQSKPTFM